MHMTLPLRVVRNVSGLYATSLGHMHIFVPSKLVACELFIHPIFYESTPHKLELLDRSRFCNWPFPFELLQPLMQHFSNKFYSHIQKLSKVRMNRDGKGYRCLYWFYCKLQIITPWIVQVFRMILSLKFYDLLKGMQSNKLKNAVDVAVYAMF